MPQLLAYAWIASVPIMFAVTAYKGLPILTGFGWINTRAGASFSKIMLCLAIGLTGLSVIEGKLILGQRPFTWAMLVLLVYAWVTFWWQLSDGLTDDLPMP